uniref:Uncharacterized protein n=1 Tax=Zonotrichia albicollis TaxID=44394 RepID=A0A8D2QIT3_ZONAL
PAGLGEFPSGLGQFPARMGEFPAGMAEFPSRLGEFPAGLGQFPSGLGQFPHGLGGFPAGLGDAQPTPFLHHRLKASLPEGNLRSSPCYGGKLHPSTTRAPADLDLSPWAQLQHPAGPKCL